MRPKLAVLISMILSGGIFSFPAVQMSSSGPLHVQNPPPSSRPKELTPEEIIKAFSAKETEFYEAWIQYTYRQDATVRVLSVNGSPKKESMRLVSDVVFRDNGERDIQIVRRSGRLSSVTFTKEDEEVINNIQPFSLTEKEIPLYDLRYQGKERVDELDCYVFSVKPKNTRGDRMYFQGKIWIDDQDLQIVRTMGKPVPERNNQKFPEFETLRQIIDDKYWFPVWTHADSVLSFPDGRVRVEETITYEEYKRFDAKATIRFDTKK
jgi:hypothetical protein